MELDTRSALFNYDKIPGTQIRIEPGVSGESIHRTLSAWNMIPESIRNGLEDIGSNIYISNNAEDGELGHAFVKAPYVVDGYMVSIGQGNNIICHALDIDGSDAETLRGTVLHEIGHEFDYAMAGRQPYMRFNPPSYTDEWGKLWDTEQDKICNIDAVAKDNVKRDKHEMFAESFRLFYDKPEELKRCSEAVYTYMDSKIKEYERKTQNLARPEHKESQTRFDVTKQEKMAVKSAIKGLKEIRTLSVPEKKRVKIFKKAMRDAVKYLQQGVSSSREAQDLVESAVMLGNNFDDPSYWNGPEFKKLVLYEKQFQYPQHAFNPTRKMTEAFEHDKNEFRASVKDAAILLMDEDRNTSRELLPKAMEYTENAIQNECSRIINPSDLKKEAAFVFGKQGFFYDSEMNPLVFRFGNGMICSSLEDLSVIGIGNDSMKKIIKDLTYAMGMDSYENERANFYINREALDSIGVNVYNGNWNSCTLEYAFENFGPMLTDLCDHVISALNRRDEEYQMSVSDHVAIVYNTIVNESGMDPANDLREYLYKCNAVVDDPNKNEPYAKDIVSAKREYLREEDLKNDLDVQVSSAAENFPQMKNIISGTKNMNAEYEEER